MKRLFLYLPMAFFALAALISCKDDDPDPISGGYWLDVYSREMNRHISDQIDDAFKLNLLLSEATLQGVDTHDAKALTNMTANNSAAKLFGSLFSNATLSVSGNNYSINYTRPSTAVSLTPTGTVTVRTGGRLLQDLDETSAWTISISGPTDDAGNGSYFYYSSGSLVIVIQEASYSIVGSTAADSWDITVGKFVAGSTNYNSQGSWENVSDWKGEFTATQTGAGNYGYQAMSGATYKFYGSLSGRSMSGYKLEYQIPQSSPLTYRASCYAAIEGGAEITKFADSETLDAGLYPAREVRMEWRRGSTDCSSIGQMSYNGIVRDMYY